MKRQTYISITNFFKRTGWPSHLIFFLCRITPVIIAVIYGIVCILFLFSKPQSLLRFAGVPLAGLLVVSAVRKIIHRKRPYERLGFYPITYKKDLKSGNSFPSRHTASAALIAVAVYAYYPFIGWIMLITALLVAASRVLSGMHYITDVAAGLLFGLIVGLIGFYPLIF